MPSSVTVNRSRPSLQLTRRAMVSGLGVSARVVDRLQAAVVDGRRERWRNRDVDAEVGVDDDPRVAVIDGVAQRRDQAVLALVALLAGLAVLTVLTVLALLAGPVARAVRAVQRMRYPLHRLVEDGLGHVEVRGDLAEPFAGGGELTGADLVVN